MSGIATATAAMVEAAAGRAKILETRKTAPGLRLLDKWAVLIGGGCNHRIGLYDMVMIKVIIGAFSSVLNERAVEDGATGVWRVNQAAFWVGIRSCNLISAREA